MYVDDTIERFIVEELLLGTLSADHLRSDQSLVSSGVLDSLGLIRMVDFLRERFGVMVEYSEIIPDNFETINSIKAFIQHKKMQASLPDINDRTGGSR